jgi:hypothetical protein
MVDFRLIFEPLYTCRSIRRRTDVGRAKAAKEKLDGLVDQARDVAIEFDAIEECEYHPGTFISLLDPSAEEAAHAKFREMAEGGELECSVEDARKAMDTAITETGTECGSCP